MYTTTVEHLLGASGFTPDPEDRRPHCSQVSLWDLWSTRGYRSVGSFEEFVEMVEGSGR